MRDWRRGWWLATAASILAVIAGASLHLAALRGRGVGLPSLIGGGRGESGVSEAESGVARDLYLKGRYEWNERTPDSLNRALDSFTKAIVHGPGYVEAYVGLADTYDLLREYSTMPRTGGLWPSDRSGAEGGRHG